MKQTIKPSGINHDINPAELDASVWNAGSNVVFDNGFTSAAPGWQETSPGLLGKPQYLLPILSGALYYWIYAGLNAAGDAGFVGVTNGETHWDITPVGGLAISRAGDWTGDILNGVPVLNNGLDAPIYWDTIPTNPCEEIPGWPANTTCKALRGFKYHLVAMNITDNTGAYVDLVIWSSAADPGNLPDSWTPEPANDAGSFTISAGTTGIIDGGQLRDAFMIYKSGSTSIMQYIAGQFVFSNRKAFMTSGILARNCWAEAYGSHYVLTNGDFIQHNGQEVNSLIDAISRTWLFAQMDPVEYVSSHLAISHKDKQIWLNFPKTGNPSCDTALVFDMVSGVFGEVDYDSPITYMVRGVLNNPGADPSFDARTDEFDLADDRFNTQLFNPTTDLLVFCREATSQLFAMQGFLRDGAEVPVFMQLLSKDMGEATAIKVLDAVWPQSQSASGINRGSLRIRVGSQLSITDPITWTPDIPILDGLKADMMVTGRFLSLEISGQQNADWRFNSFDLNVNLVSEW